VQIAGRGDQRAGEVGPVLDWAGLAMLWAAALVQGFGG